MALKATKAPTAGHGGALRKVVHRQAIDYEPYTPHARRSQVRLLRRFGLPDATARLIGELAFAAPASWTERRV